MTHPGFHTNRWLLGCPPGWGGGYPAPCISSSPLARKSPSMRSWAPIGAGQEPGGGSETRRRIPQAPQWPHAPCPRTWESKGHGHKCPGVGRAAGDQAPTRKPPPPDTCSAHCGFPTVAGGGVGHATLRQRCHLSCVPAQAPPGYTPTPR